MNGSYSEKNKTMKLEMRDWRAREQNRWMMELIVKNLPLINKFWKLVNTGKVDGGAFAAADAGDSMLGPIGGSPVGPGPRSDVGRPAIRLPSLPFPKPPITKFPPFRLRLPIYSPLVSSL